MDSNTSIGEEALERVTAAVQQATGVASGRQDLSREAQLRRQKARAARDARDQQGRAAEQAVDDLAEHAKAATETDKRLKAASARAQRKAAEREQGASRRLEESPDTDGGLVERAICGGLGIVRLPLTVVENLTGKSNSQWVPAVTFKTLEAGVMQVAGSVLRNDALTTRARAKQAAASHASTAIDKRAQSTKIMAQAQAHTAQAVAQVQESAEAADRAATERRQALDTNRQQRKSEVASTTQTRQKAAQATQGVGKRARHDELEAAADEQQAAIHRKRAARKAENVLDLDDEIQSAKRARNSH